MKKSMIEQLKQIAKYGGFKFLESFLEVASVEELQKVINNYSNMLNNTVAAENVTELEWNGDWTDHSDGMPYKKYSEWVDEQINAGNTHYYAKGREEFSKYEAFKNAAKFGKKYVILEDLS